MTTPAAKSDLTTLDDDQLITQRAALRTRLQQMPEHAMQRASLAKQYDVLTTEFDRRARGLATGRDRARQHQSVGRDRLRGAAAVTPPPPPSPAPRDVSGMDDFEVIAERQSIVATLAALTDRYRLLNREISTRDTLKWMLAP